MPLHLPAGGHQRRLVFGHAGAPSIDAQPHGRMRVVGLEDRNCGGGSLSLQRLDEPARMRGAHGEVHVDGLQHGRLLTLESSQYRIDEAGAAREAELACRIDGLGDGGVLGGLTGQQLEQADLEQRAQFRLHPVQRALREPGQDLDQPEVPAQRTVGERTLQAARRALVRVAGEQLIE